MTSMALASLALAACTSSSHRAASSTSSSTSTVPTTTTTIPTSTSAARGTTTIAYNGLVFHAPSGWGVNARNETAYIGVLNPALDTINLRVTTGFTRPVDSLQPVPCNGGSVAVVESSPQLVGSKAAEFRRWRVTCPDGRAEEHRAWVLPVSEVAIYEQRFDPTNADVVA